MRSKNSLMLMALGLGLLFASDFSWAKVMPTSTPTPSVSVMPSQGPKRFGAPAPSSVPSPLTSAAVSASPSPVTGLPPVTQSDASKLLNEFKKAQKWELKALDHRNKFEIRELKASQKARQKDWENNERQARHAYFKEHTQGPDRRAYVKDFIQRRKGLLEMFKNERVQRAHEQDVRRRSLKDDQAGKLREFESLLKQGVRPPDSLWPSGS